MDESRKSAVKGLYYLHRTTHSFSTTSLALLVVGGSKEDIYTRKTIEGYTPESSSFLLRRKQCLFPFLGISGVIMILFIFTSTIYRSTSTTTKKLVGPGNGIRES